VVVHDEHADRGRFVGHVGSSRVVATDG
jgi:hypothetical protein